MTLPRTMAYRSPWLRIAVMSIATGGVLAPSPARAGSASDGAYGRLDGDLALSLEAGLREAFPGEALGVRASSLYLYTVGLIAQYEESFGLADSPSERVLAVGMEIRPLFLPRFANDLERGPSHLDLWLDSLSCGLGVYGAMLPDEGCHSPERACWSWGLELGTGMELPLLGRADGPFLSLRGALRWPGRPGDELAESGSQPWGLLTATLGYRISLTSHLVDLGDEAR